MNTSLQRYMKKFLFLSKVCGLLSCDQVELGGESRIYIFPVCQLTELDSEIIKENNCKLINTITKIGVEKKNIFFLDDTIKPNSSTIADIESSDCIIIPGGRMETGIAKLCDYNLDSVLRNYSGYIIGISAGALLLFHRYIVTPNWAYPNMEVCEGLGIIEKDWYIEVHYDENDAEQIASLKVIKSIVNGDIYGIKNSGFIYVDEKNNLIYKDVEKI